MTEPLTPIECDLRALRFMPVEIERLFRSKAWLQAKRNPALGFYMMNLWARSWHEVPAASLEDDDDVLADAAMCSPDEWPSVKAAALRGWVKCTDGRLYHPVVAEKALDAWKQKLDFDSRRAGFQKMQSDKGKASAAKRRTLKANDNPQPESNRSGTDTQPGGNRAPTDGQPMKGNGNGKVIAKAASIGANPARENARDRLLALCEIFQTSPATNPAVIPRWTDELAKLVAEGLDYEKHILPAARAVAAKGSRPSSLNYLRGKAGELRAAEEMESAQQQRQAAAATDADWRARMRIFSGLVREAPAGSWDQKWGPKPGEQGCQCPRAIVDEFARKEAV